MFKAQFAAAMAVGVLLGAADAPPKAPYWTQRPSPADNQAAADAADVKAGTVGRGIVVCKAKADGALEACQTVVESPIGSGIAKMLLTLAPKFQVNMAAPSAPPAGGNVPLTQERYPLDTPPDWLRKPTGSDLMEVWPTKALARAKGGKATINCLVSQQGALFECVVVTETPPGEHFGDAAVALAPQFLMKPARLKGEPVVSAISVPINFLMPPGSSRRDNLEPGKGMVSAAMVWPEAPGYEAVAAAYPAKARAAKRGGRATITCEFTREGRLTNCHTITEEPKHEGFGDAARLLAKQFRAFPTLSNGKNIVGAEVQLPVVFDPSMLDGGQPVIGKAQWAGLPSAANFSTAFGQLAVSGTTRVRMACTVLQGGTVSDCHVEQEDPAGHGVGQAALGLTAHFHLTTWTAEGLPTVGGTIRIPLRYEPGSPAAPAPTAPPVPFKPNG